VTKIENNKTSFKNSALDEAKQMPKQVWN